jgi:hypothetical protein
MRGLARFALRERIADDSLIEAIKRAESGSIDADLGGGLIKQRVARQGRGRSGGYRMMIAYKTNDMAIFLLGFAKNEQDNVTSEQLAALRKLANVWLRTSEARIADAIDEGVLHEVTDDEADA